jgi:hypothetical protein
VPTQPRGARGPRCALTIPDGSRRTHREADRAPRSPEALPRAVLPWGFCPYDVSEMRAATCTGIASPGCATPSGFLNLVTSCSAHTRTALFHAESVHGVEALRGFPLPVAATAFAAPCPSSSWPAHRPRLGASPKANSSTPPSAHALLRDSCTWKVRSRRSSVTRLRRPILSQPLFPSGGISP